MTKISKSIDLEIVSAVALSVLLSLDKQATPNQNASCIKLSRLINEKIEQLLGPVSIKLYRDQVVKLAGLGGFDSKLDKSKFPGKMVLIFNMPEVALRELENTEKIMRYKERSEYRNWTFPRQLKKYRANYLEATEILKLVKI